MNFTNIERFILIMMFFTLILLLVSVRLGHKQLPKLIDEINKSQVKK
jgi:hypothetical protein